MEFGFISNNPQTRALSLYIATPCLAILLVNLILFVTGIVNGEKALFAGLGLTLAPAAAIWNVQQYGRGSACPDPSQLVVRTRGWTHSYNWADIADVSLTSLGEKGTAVRLWARILFWPEAEPLVELRLKRPLRIGLWPGRYGTRPIGVPLIGGKRVPLFLKEPESFVRTAKGYLPKTGQLPT